MQTPALAAGELADVFLLIAAAEIEAAKVRARIHLEAADLQQI